MHCMHLDLFAIFRCSPATTRDLTAVNRLRRSQLSPRPPRHLRLCSYPCKDQQQISITLHIHHQVHQKKDKSIFVSHSTNSQPLQVAPCPEARPFSHNLAPRLHLPVPGSLPPGLHGWGYINCRSFVGGRPNAFFSADTHVSVT